MGHTIINNIQSTAANEIYHQENGAAGTNTNVTNKSDSRDKDKPHDQQ